MVEGVLFEGGGPPKVVEGVLSEGGGPPKVVEGVLFEGGKDFPSGKGHKKTPVKTGENFD